MMHVRAAHEEIQIGHLPGHDEEHENPRQDERHNKAKQGAAREPVRRLPPNAMFCRQHFVSLLKSRTAPSMLAREMFRQQVAGLLHTVNDARREFGFAKITGHGVGQLPPELVPALRVNALVADDGKLVRTRRHKNQHTVPFRRLVHAQPQEFRLSSGDRIINVFVADNNLDLTGGLVFGVMNRCDDAVVLQVLGKGARVHKLPAPSGAAATKTAPAARKSTATAKAATTTPAGPAAPGIKKAAHREKEKTEVHKQNYQ